MGYADCSADALTPGSSFTSFRTSSLLRGGDGGVLPDGVEDDGEVDIGRGVFGEEIIKEGGDGEAWGGGVEFDGSLEGLVDLVPCG